MSKISIKSVLKTKDSEHIYSGKAIRNNNQIIYNDGKVMTIITLGETIWIERKQDYHMKLGFIAGEKVKGIYKIPEGILDVETETTHLSVTDEGIKIIYSVKINNAFIDNFELNLNYSIDS